MKKANKMLALLITGIMIFGSVFSSYAEVNTETQIQTEAEADMETKTQSENDALAQAETEVETQAAVSTDTAADAVNETETEVQPETEEIPTPETLSPEEQNLTVIPRIVEIPQLQAKVLTAQNQWTQPVTTDQWCGAGDETFHSVSITMDNAVGNIHYRVYTTTNGWTNWAMNGQQTDVPADFSPVEAIQIRFSGPVQYNFNLCYTGIFFDGQQIGWGVNGTTAGSMNMGMPLKAFYMVFIPKGSDPGFEIGTSLIAPHADGIQYIDGQLRYIHGDGSNYTGWGWQEGQRYYFVDSYPVTGWHYIDGYKYYFAEDGKLVSDLEPILGNQGPFHIKVNKQMNTITVYVPDGENGYITPFKTFLCSTGNRTPIGNFKTPEKYRWRLMHGGSYTQYATRLGAGLSFLFHSILYSRPNINALQTSTFNRLGVARSSGCIRLTSGDAKWIYDYCPIGTTIEVYNSPIPGPFERPSIPEVIPSDRHWDPTDPVAREQFMH